MQAWDRRNYISIFAGCGGLSLGLYKSGWQGMFAIEKSPMAFKTLKHNLIDRKSHFDWPKWLPMEAMDINHMIRKHKQDLIDLKGEVDLVAGGPPCQGFSFAGRRDEHDQRNKLVNSYVNFIKHTEPELILFENVSGFNARLNNKEPYSTIVEKKIRKIGYSVYRDMVQFQEFGVPQRRERFILIGSLSTDVEEFFPKLSEKKKGFLANIGLRAPISTKSAISDLESKHGLIDSPDSTGFKAGTYGKARTNYQRLMREENGHEYPDSHRFANHNKETIERFRYIIQNSPKGKAVPKEIKERFNLKKMTTRLIDPSAPCPTLTTLPDDYIHYSEPRILTVREYARVQSFDDWFEIRDKYTTGGERRVHEVPRYTQIGNAIPPLFAEQAGNVLGGML